MNCPFCGYFDSRVIDSRDVNDGIRRRRQCLQCDLRFTTYERLERASLLVIKKDGAAKSSAAKSCLAASAKRAKNARCPPAQ